MPYKPKRPCSYPGCPKLTDGRYCPEHKKLMEKQYDAYQRSRESTAFYRSSDWKKMRANYLIEHPFCVECNRNGKLTKATVVDHIIPIRMGGPLLEESNLQSLCASCHTRKSIKEGSRFSSQNKSE